MLAGIDAFDATFLADLNNTQNRITQANQQISSGVAVSEPSDDPTAIASILDTQNQIDQISQAQTNLNQAGTIASAADGALAGASTLLNQLISIAAQGSNSSTTAATDTTLSQQVQGIAQQLVGLANTGVQGQYIFGGDDPSTQPYTYDWSVAGGVVQNNTAANTVTLQNASGSTIIPGLTAEQIFDSRNSDGTPAAGNIFQNVYALGQALQTGDVAAIQAATAGLKSSVAVLGQATTANGDTQAWIAQSNAAATASLTTAQTQLGSLRDANIAQDATELSLDQTALQAAIAAHGSLNVKSLFSYLG